MIKNSRGQALITLLFFTIIAIMIASTAIAIISTGSISTGGLEEEETSYYTAESGAENALLALLRNPSYTGETLNLNGGTATTEVTGSNPYTITSTSSIGTIKHSVQVIVSYNNNVLSVTSWKQIY